MDMTDYKKFWRGEFSLGQAFWVMYLGINLALGFSGLLLMFVMTIFQSQQLIDITHFGFVVIISGYTLWSGVGMWRCSPLRGKDGAGTIFWPFVVKIIIVAASISAISSLLQLVDS